MTFSWPFTRPAELFLVIFGFDPLKCVREGYVPIFIWIGCSRDCLGRGGAEKIWPFPCPSDIIFVILSFSSLECAEERVCSNFHLNWLLWRMSRKGGGQSPLPPPSCCLEILFGYIANRVKNQFFHQEVISNKIYSSSKTPNQDLTLLATALRSISK